MHSPRRFGFVGLLAAAFLLLPSAADRAAAQRAFSFAYDQPHTTAYGIAGDMFDAKLKELSNGTMGIDQFPGAQLGQEPVMLQKIRTGDIDFIITSTANRLGGAAGGRVFVALSSSATRTISPRRSPIPESSRHSATMIAGYGEGRARARAAHDGPAQHLLKKEIKSVADVKGEKIRVQATMTEDTHFPAYGAQTVHMPFGEVYTSLQTGVVQIAENGVNVYLANKHYEVAPVLSMTEHEANNNCIWVSDKTWNSLTAQEKNWVQAAADEVAKREPTMGLKLEADSAEKLAKMGVKIVENVDKSGFMKAAAADPGQARQAARPACGEDVGARPRREVTASLIAGRRAAAPPRLS